MIISFFAAVQSIGQISDAEYSSNPDIRLRWKIDGDKTLLRICPINGAVWEFGNLGGYKIEKYLESSNGKTLVKTFDVNVQEAELKRTINSTAEPYQTVYDLIYFNLEESEDDLFDPSELSPAEMIEGRYFWVMLAVNDNFELAKMIGLGIEDDFIPNEKYSYELSLNNPSYAKTFKLTVDPSTYEDIIPAPPRFNEFDKSVKFTWETTFYKPVFSGYDLEYSDNNISFRSLSDVSFSDFPDSISLDREKNLFSKIDSFPNNDVRRYYRLRGIDYFGQKSPPSQVVSAQGVMPIYMAPSFTDAIQTDSNHVVLRWEVQPEYEDLIDEFVITYADSIDNPFVTIGRFDSNTREAIYTMDYETNHYILMTIPKRGLPIQSYPIFCMSYDNIPPHQPTGLEATIDTNGIVQLIWNQNTDADLKAYEVFRTNFEVSEFFQRSRWPVEDTTFTDTLSLDLSIEYIYYKIRALDQRHIGSDFSEIVKLKRPDINPPVEADIYYYDASRDSIIIKWNNSPSEDVVSHDLYRKIWEEENQWTLIANFEIGIDSSEYVDRDLIINKLYAYTLVANDDDGLQSPPSSPVMVTPVDNGIRAEIKNFSGEYRKEEKSITLNWDYDESNVFRYYIYKSPTSKPISLFKKIGASDSSIVDDAVAKNKSYQYYIKAVFEDGTVSPFSSKVIIKTEEKEN